MDLLESIQSVMLQLESELIEQLKSRVPVAFEIGAHIMNSGGKRIRPQLTIIAARMGGYTGWDAIKLSGAIECIHTATLLHDDVVDRADTRRGRPAANTVWSNEMCVLGGDFILAKAFSALTSLNNLRILELISRTTEKLSEGELFQMMHIGDINISEEDYLRIITDKTAILMEAACRGGAILGGLDPELENSLAKFGFDLGIAFQMTDDVIDYESDSRVMGKHQGKDLQEGKLTLPLISALKNANLAEKTRIQRILKTGSIEGADFQWVRNFIHEKGGIKYTLDKSRSYLEEAQEQMSFFPDSAEKQALTKLAQSVLRRTY